MLSRLIRFIGRVDGPPNSQKSQNSEKKTKKMIDFYHFLFGEHFFYHGTILKQKTECP